MLHLPPFGRNSNVKLTPQFDPLLFGGLGRPCGSNMVPIEISSKHCCSTSKHTISLSCTVWPQCTTRQTDSAMAIVRYSIGGLKVILFVGVLLAKNTTDEMFVIDLWISGIRITLS